MSPSLSAVSQRSRAQESIWNQSHAWQPSAATVGELSGVKWWQQPHCKDKFLVGDNENTRKVSRSLPLFIGQRTWLSGSQESLCPPLSWGQGYKGKQHRMWAPRGRRRVANGIFLREHEKKAEGFSWATDNTVCITAKPVMNLYLCKLRKCHKGQSNPLHSAFHKFRLRQSCRSSFLI